MDKRTFYVSVAKSEILEDPQAVSFEFVIEATDAEIDRLQELFVAASSAEERNTSRFLTPYEAFPEPNQDIKEIDYDVQLKAIYSMLHELGTPETRQHIEDMNVIPGTGL